MVFFIGYFDSLENADERRRYTLSAVNKITYILSVLERIGQNAQIYSCSETLLRHRCKAKQISMGQKTVLNLPHSFGRGSKIKNVLNRFWIKLQTFCILLRKIDSDDVVVVYHSPVYMRMIKFLKRIINFTLILEVEEIYGDVSSSAVLKKAEMRHFKIADAYMFPSELLDRKVNSSFKPSAVIYGSYQIEKDYIARFNDGKIHCIYAGIFDPRKGSVNAVTAAEFLDDGYHIHIIGFGNEGDKKVLLDSIDKTSYKTKCTVTFDGLLSGDAYTQLLQKCDIGLSTQNLEAAFNETSFPSKILSYMANGLKVVSIRIRAIEEAAFADELFFYDRNQPELIAKAIRTAAATVKLDSRTIVKTLDNKFQSDLENILQKLSTSV